jgi:alpha-galactosidase
MMSTNLVALYKVFGVRPNSAFLYTIPATGDRPMKFAVENIPKGLTVNSDTGNIKGILSKAGTYRVTLAAQNKWGKTERNFRIVVGDTTTLTPPMGWKKKIKAAAQAMKDTGLINHGWAYINIDDTWQGKRGGPFNAIQGNEKFPDIKGLCDYVHGLRLKIGIYSTPWVVSYAGYLGSSSNNKNGDWEFGEYPMRRGPCSRRMPGREHGKYSFAKNDAKQWAEWGIDYLKYDWRPNDVKHVEEMSLALRETGRDTVYSLSNSADFEQAGEWARLSNCWRTTGDIKDSWESVSGIGLSQSQWAPYAGPGHWNDPDMLAVGQVGWGPNLHPSRLSPEEQYTHISLWCLLSAPLLLGCDLNQLDEFTLNLLTNDEVLQVDQDPLGKQATCIAKKHRKQIWAKDMEDGSKAVGLFNLDFPFLQPANMTVNWQTLGIQGKYRVRDLWRQKNLGVFEGSFTAEVPAPGVVLVRISPKETENK